MRNTTWRIAAVAASACLVLGGCGSDGDSSVKAAQARVDAKQKDLADAKDAAKEATAAFCDEAASYITALDRYGDLLHATTPTVGDVRDAGGELSDPQAAALSSAEDAVSAREDLVAAEQELAEAKTALSEAQSTSPKPTPTSKATNVVPELPTATVNRVQAAQSDLDTAVGGISDDTPLVQAAQQLNAAALALEMSWLRLLSEAGCLTDEQQVAAEAAVHDYTAAIQQSLTLAGYYTDEVDGIYGPATVDAVEALQDANGLPVTGAVDKATATALQSELVAQGGATEKQSVAATAAVQQTLKLVGYWPGAVDGDWTPALTDALKAFQTDLGVKPTGTVDAATVAAFHDAVAAATAPDPTPSSTPSDEPSESPTESPAG